MSESTYEVLLEKKARGRGFGLTRPWSVRTFKLSKQRLEYYDGEKLKGTIDISGAICSAISPDDADQKLFPFQLDNGKEKLILNASCEEIRQRCLEVFALAAAKSDWTLVPVPPPNPALIAVNLMRTDDRNKLHAEDKKLEEERLQKVAEITANQMGEVLADSKLQQAHSAKKQQHQAQEEEAMNLMKGLSAKGRFKTALKQNNMVIARSAAAEMLQGTWRCRVARRQVILKRAEKEKLLMEGYARKIQSRYRCRLAKRRVEAIKTEKLRIKREIGARTIQCAWRSYAARKRFNVKREEHLQTDYNRRLARQRGIIKLQNTMRTFMAKRCAARIRVNFPTVAMVKVKKVEGLNVTDPTHADPTAIVSACVLMVSEREPHRVNPFFRVSDETIKQSGKITSHYRIDAISSKATALVASSTSMDFVVVTLMDKNSPSKDDCLGQAFIRIPDIRRQIVSYDTPVEVTVPISSHMLLPIQDANKENLVTVRKAGTGSVTVSIMIADPSYSTCGWLWKVSESLLSSAWKKRWFVLVNGELQYFNSEFNLELRKNAIDGTTITSIKEEAHKGRQATKISFSADGKESFWLLDFDENQSKLIQRLWQRRLLRSAVNLDDPEMEKIRKKFGEFKSSGHENLAVGIKGKTHVPVSKRMSVFN